MGRQVGLIKVSGNIGGVSFYKSNGENLARVANGPSKDKIQNDSSFVRTRENNQEFGGAAMMGKALRLALGASLITIADNRLTSRLTALFKDICNRSTETRGQRPIMLSLHRNLLVNTEFNNKLSFGSVFNAPYTFNHNAQRNEVIINIPAFQPQTFIHAPSGATHFKLFSVLGVVSDYVYNAATGSYEASDNSVSTVNAVSYTDATALNTPTPVALDMTTNLTGQALNSGALNLVHCLGIEFYQRVGSIDYLLAQGNAMKVISVF